MAQSKQPAITYSVFWDRWLQTERRRLMHFDIVEAVRQKQFKHQQSLSVENGDVVDISLIDGTVIVRPGVSPEPDDEASL